MKRLVILLALIALVLLPACTKVYVCYDNTTQNRQSLCPTVPSPTISLKEAQQAVDSYGQAYALARNDRFTRVTLFAQNKSYYSDILFTNAKDGSVSAVKLEINGKTRQITCIDGCTYLEGVNPNFT